MARSPNQSCEGPAFSDSDMSADESIPLEKNRISSLLQEKRVLTVEVETYKLKCKQLMEENKSLRKASVSIVSKSKAWSFLWRTVWLPDRVQPLFCTFI